MRHKRNHIADLINFDLARFVVIKNRRNRQIIGMRTTKHQICSRIIRRNRKLRDGITKKAGRSGLFRTKAMRQPNAPCLLCQCRAGPLTATHDACDHLPKHRLAHWVKSLCPTIAVGSAASSNLSFASFIQIRASSLYAVIRHISLPQSCLLP